MQKKSAKRKGKGSGGTGSLFARTGRVGPEGGEDAKAAVPGSTAATQAQPLPLSSFVNTLNGVDQLETDRALDSAVGAIARSAAAGELTMQDENTLIDLAIAKNPALLSLARHYMNDPLKLIGHALRNIHLLSADPAAQAVVSLATKQIDAVIIGGGLSGLVAALTILDRGGRVAVLEKEPFLGGNSAWASSGMNAVDKSGVDATPGDSVQVFAEDTLKSSGKQGPNPLISILTGESGEARQWIKSRLGVGLDKVSQLGGHSFPRTWRPSTGITGAELVFTIQKVLEKMAAEPEARVEILKRSRATRLVTASGEVVGVEYVKQEPAQNSTAVIRSASVIIASGGYANDRSDTHSLLAKYRPDLLDLDTTNGRWTTGDGIKLAMQAGALTVEMDQVQVHPTAFIDPKEPNATMKVLCAELLRGVGGLLLDPATGERFCNELGYRDYVVARMREVVAQRNDSGHARLEFLIVLTQQQASHLQVHLPHYVRKGLLTKFDSLHAAEAGLSLPEGALERTLQKYNMEAAAGRDEFGKVTFENTPLDVGSGFYVGTVTPALHYSIGGLLIDPTAAVLRQAVSGPVPIPGLFAVGEATGGIHGKNRLGGNAMTECIVFGRLVGSHIPLPSLASHSHPNPEINSSKMQQQEAPKQAGLREISLQELGEHKTAASCWVAMYGRVYDLTEFLEEHPGGARAVVDIAGTDGTKVFHDVHTQSMLDIFTPIGLLKA